MPVLQLTTEISGFFLLGKKIKTTTSFTTIVRFSFCATKICGLLTVLFANFRAWAAFVRTFSPLRSSSDCARFSPRNLKFETTTNRLEEKNIPKFTEKSGWPTIVYPLSLYFSAFYELHRSGSRFTLPLHAAFPRKSVLRRKPAGQAHDNEFVPCVVITFEQLINNCSFSVLFFRDSHTVRLVPSPSNNIDFSLRRYELTDESYLFWFAYSYVIDAFNNKKKKKRTNNGQSYRQHSTVCYIIYKKKTSNKLRMKIIRMSNTFQYNCVERVRFIVSGTWIHIGSVIRVLKK